MPIYFSALLIVGVGASLLRLIGASGVEARLKTLRRQGFGHEVPNLFSPWEQLQAFGWMIGGEFRSLKDRQARLFGKIAQIGAIGQIVFAAGVAVGLVLMVTGVIGPSH